ncbi:Ger(x)C family spore germination protein [Halalkalibacillus sediminis]|uniref:Ger(X)C family spore germination protein n=1 Tax=Halalkalibacillus sediminis TaxID=2018042 RepID=A0A2I0QSY0_9BACI|nr:Ger(x)C family spore germination protein [Halalkalibacillus sediminis]PKR77419.1 Ger(x)C family spore germination protein [Halalkalibacillus sediminis]
MKNSHKYISLIVCLFLLTGCWDQKPFKNKKIITTAAYDRSDSHNIETSVIIPSVTGGQESAQEEEIQLFNTKATTALALRNELDLMISKRIDPSVLEVILIGEELAKRDIYPMLDAFYRNPRSNLNSKVAIVKGKAGEALSQQVSNESNPSEYFLGLIHAAMESTHYSNDNLQLLCAELFEPGQDFVLPYLELDEQSKSVKYQGLGLFHGRSFTGEVLTSDEALLLMLMSGYKGKSARITRKLTDEHEDDFLNYITIDVMKSKRDIQYQLDEKKIMLDFTFTVKISEYPLDHLSETSTILNIKDDLKKILEEDMTKIFNKLQEANSDVFGLGRRAEAFHYNEWKDMNWEEDFSNLTIEPSIEVEIKHGGSLN